MTTIPQVVLVLLAISLDTSTSTALQKEIAVALDTTFQSIADPNVVAEIVLLSAYSSYKDAF